MAIENISLLGGHIVLDFVNTVGDHLSSEPGEGFHTYADIAKWAAHAAVISPEHAARLIDLAQTQPEHAAEVLASTVSIRETIYRLLLSAIRHQQPDTADVDGLNHLLATTPARTQLNFENDHYSWQFPSENISLDAHLWRLVWSAADLLISTQLTQVKLCEGDECGWLFLDTSRNQSRRWCSMADCGNRAKANRYYKRHKSE